MRSIFKYSAIGVAAVALGIQFVRPARTNPPVDPAKDIVGQPSLPSNVRAMLERSCFDCHSNRTRWPLYSHIAPVSWLVANDVNSGRRHLNFSEWEGYKVGRRLSKLESAIGEIEKGGMPPGTYLLTHPDAVLSPAEKELLIRWAEALSDSLTATGK
jgi:hypothetical protein